MQNADFYIYDVVMTGKFTTNRLCEHNSSMISCTFHCLTSFRSDVPLLIHDFLRPCLSKGKNVYVLFTLYFCTNQNYTNNTLPKNNLSCFLHYLIYFWGKSYYILGCSNIGTPGMNGSMDFPPPKIIVFYAQKYVTRILFIKLTYIFIFFYILHIGHIFI